MATINTSVNVYTVTITVSMTASDASAWGVLIASKHDHGLGLSAYPDYPYYVDMYTSTERSDSRSNYYNTLDDYVAVLFSAINTGTLDYSTFSIVRVPQISAEYFLVNNVIPSTQSISASTTDTIVLRCTATDLTVGTTYHADVRYKNSSGTEYSLSTPDVTASAVTEHFDKTLSLGAGTYTTVSARLFTSGRDVAFGNGKIGVGEILTVTAPSTNTYRCSGSTCVEGGGTLPPGCNNSCTGNQVCTPTLALGEILVDTVSCPTASVTLAAHSLDINTTSAGVGTLHYAWKEGSTNLGSTKTITWTPTVAGNHTISVVVTDSCTTPNYQSMTKSCIILVSSTTPTTGWKCTDATNKTCTSGTTSDYTFGNKEGCEATCGTGGDGTTTVCSDPKKMDTILFGCQDRNTVYMVAGALLLLMMLKK